MIAVKVRLLKAWGAHKEGDEIDLPEDQVDSLVETGHVEVVDPDGVKTSIINEEVQKAFSSLAISIKDMVAEALKQATKDGVVPTAVAKTTKVREQVAVHPRFGFDEGEKGFGEFAMAVKHASSQGVGFDQLDERLKVVVGDVMGQKVPPSDGYANTEVGEEGGILVAPEFSTSIFERALSGMALLPMTDSYTVRGNSMRFNGLIDDDKSAAAQRNGGVIGYWVEEGHGFTASRLKWKFKDLRLHKLGVLASVTDEQMSDGAVSLGQFLTRKSGDEIRFLTNDAIIRGTGVGKPQGIMVSGGTVLVAKEAGQAAETVLAENVIKMWVALPARFRSSAVWLVNPEVEGQLDLMTIGMGAANFPVYLPAGGLSASPYGTLKGRPVMSTDLCEALGTAGDIILASMNQYLTIVKGGVQSAVSIHLWFDYMQVAYRFSFRVDGQSWWDSALTPYKGRSGFTQGAFVTLATRD
jgi:HK97 family phage major capsid protein